MNVLFNKRVIFAAAIFGLGLWGSISSSALCAAATEPAKPFEIKSMTPDTLAWTDAPFSLPSGAKMAILEGSPSEYGPYTLRLRVPANYKFPPHFSSTAQHLTVISGTIYIGVGEKLNIENGKALPAGSFVVIPPKLTAYLWTSSEAIIQLHGIGPWEIHYENNAKK
jgi:hypothetical protein